MVDLPSFTQEDEDAFLDSSYQLIETDNGTTGHRDGDVFLFYADLIQIEKDLCKLAKDKNPTLENYDFILNSRKNISNLKFHFRLSRFSPYIQLYFKAVEQRLDEQQFLDFLKMHLCSEAFAEQLLSKKKRVSENKISLLKYIDALFEYRSKLLVIRLDLSYSDEFKFKSIDNKVSKPEDALIEIAKQIQQERNQLIKKLKETYKKDFIGYVWKLEYGSHKGFHYHTIFFLDGSNYRQDITIAQSIGELWKKITKEKGLYWNLNSEKQRFEKNDRVATGMIKHDDKQLRQNLERMATYLVKTDYFAKTVLSDKSHTYDRGQSPRKKKIGRPRN